jgi:ferrous iron transport protein B
MYFLGIFTVILGGLFLKVFRKKIKLGGEMISPPNPSSITPSTTSAAATATLPQVGRGEGVTPSPNSSLPDHSFILELPCYRLPKAKNMAKEVWEKTRGFAARAGTVIVIAAIILWFLQNFNFRFQMVEINDSILASIGRVLAWVFVPLGFGNWQATIALISGMVGRELVVASFGVLLGGDLNAALAEIFTPQSAYAFMAFVLLAAPCVAAIAVTKRELGSKRQMAAAIAFQCAAAYLVALVINQVGNLWVYNRAACISLIAAALLFVAFWLFVRGVVKAKRRGRCPRCCADCNRPCPGAPKESA